MEEIKISRNVLITGCSKGIGLALAKAYKHQGYTVAGCARTLSPAMKETVDLAIACDVSDSSQVKQMIDTLKDQLKLLHVIVNNAGLAGSNSLHQSDSDAFWYKVISVNLHGTYHVCKESLALLQDNGRIINITSVLAHCGVADQTAYCAAKHGVLGFTRALARHLAKRHITVNAIAPGWVDSDMARQRAMELHTSLQALSAAIPLQRILQPQEIASLALYLSGDEAGGITGQSFIIDGGYLS